MAFESHNVSLKLEIDNIDVTSYLPARPPLTIGKSRDFPNFGVFNADGINIPLRNDSGMFDPGKASNFFTARGRDATGRGARVLMTVVRDTTEQLRMVGEVQMVNQSLDSAIVTLVVRDLSLRLRRGKIQDFGEQVSFLITDFDNAAADYGEGVYAFRFPKVFTPIQRGSVSGTIHANGVDESIEIVENLEVSGALDYRRAVIDYANARLILEAEPPDGADSVIDLRWKVSYRFKRPDFIIREIMKERLFPELPNYAIDRVTFEAPNPVFGTHGKPYFQDAGITRWLKKQPNTDDWWMTEKGRLLKYDEALDEYEVVATVPDDETIAESPPGGYGSIIDDESHDLPPATNLFSGLAVTPTRIYMSQSVSRQLRVFDRDFNRLQSEEFSIIHTPSGLFMFDGLLYTVALNQISIYNPVTKSRIRWISDVDWPKGITWRPSAIAVTSDKFYIAWNSPHDRNGTYIQVTDHNGDQIMGEGFDATRSEYSGYGNVSIEGMAIDPNYIYLLFGANDTLTYDIEVRTYDGTLVASRSIAIPKRLRSPTYGGLSIQGDRLFGLFADTEGGHPSRFVAISLDGGLNYHSFAIEQMDTPDFENFYTLTTNTISGDITHGSTFNQVRIQKYDANADTWSTLLDPITGQPQLAHPYDLVNEIGEYADNRKNFQVVVRNSKTLIFFRRVQASTAGVAYRNDTDDTLTDVYSETFGVNDGLPYSMDFVLDERTDGIYVYTFVAKYTLSGANFTSATLKIYRRRVEPIAVQAEIFSETFTSTSGTDEYPISVSDAILADDRSKFYFVLEYFSESSTEAGRSELCEVAKDGSGGRTVLKTYDDPLLGPRSPAKMGSRYFYLEGGWVRRAKTSTDEDVPTEEHYYPNGGGHLIEIKSGGAITDHGIVWRSGSKADSPDPSDETEIYDGWGLFNSVVSNMEVADGTLNFVAGYGLPFRIDNNLPTGLVADPIYRIDNFARLQWGQKLTMKLEDIELEGTDYWTACTRMALVNNAELGFTPQSAQVAAHLTKNPLGDEWEAWATLFFRERTVVAGTLFQTVGGSGSAVILVEGAGSEEFPAPPAGQQHTVIIDREIFTYTGTGTTGENLRLRGVERAAYGSMAAVHPSGADVLFVDALIRDTDTSLVQVETKHLDLSNLYNTIIINHADGEYRQSDAVSVATSGEISLSIDTPYLTSATQRWIELLAARYLERFKDFQDVITLRIPFSPLMDIGRLVVLKTERGFLSDYDTFEVMRRTHDLRTFQTTLILRGY